MVRSMLTLSALSLLACHGCNDANAPPANNAGPPTAASPPTAAPTTGETIVHAEDDGKSFDVARGAPVTFKLASNAGTGFVWVPTSVDPSVLAQQGDRTSEAPSDRPGSAKTDVYHFVAAAIGTTTVEMSLKRPFGSTPPARAIHVTVVVH
jgi:predicted secreted protein